MKIFIIIPSLGTGGAERVGVLLANGFSNCNHEVVVFSNLSRSRDYQVRSNIKIIDISDQTGGRISKVWHTVKIIRKQVKKEPPSVFIGIMGVFSLIAYLACIGLGVPIIATIHNSFERPSYAPMSNIEKFLKFFINKLFTKVTVLTTSDRLFVGNKLKNTIVMSNPLALSPITHLTPRRNQILAMGRLDDWHYKGFDVLIKSFAKLLNGSKVAEPRSKFKSNDIAFKIREEGWKLQIAGTGSEGSLNYLKKLCKENEVEDSVEFLGFRKDVEKLYQDASIFVLSSRYEGFGLVLIEAMSQGCACIACDYKGRQREILNPTQDQPSETRNLNPETHNRKFEACETGILCEPDNVEALAEAMAKMITDDDYRESIRKNAIERSSYYSIENTMDRWEQLLNQIIKK